MRNVRKEDKNEQKGDNPDIPSINELKNIIKTNHNDLENLQNFYTDSSKKLVKRIQELEFKFLGKSQSLSGLLDSLGWPHDEEKVNEDEKQLTVSKNGLIQRGNEKNLYCLKCFQEINTKNFTNEFVQVIPHSNYNGSENKKTKDKNARNNELRSNEDIETELIQIIKKDKEELLAQLFDNELITGKENLKYLIIQSFTFMCPK